MVFLRGPCYPTPAFLVVFLLLLVVLLRVAARPIAAGDQAVSKKNPWEVTAKGHRNSFKIPGSRPIYLEAASEHSVVYGIPENAAQLNSSIEGVPLLVSIITVPKHVPGRTAISCEYYAEVWSCPSSLFDQGHVISSLQAEEDLLGVCMEVLREKRWKGQQVDLSEGTVVLSSGNNPECGVLNKSGVRHHLVLKKVKAAVRSDGTLHANPTCDQTLPACKISNRVVWFQSAVSRDEVDCTFDSSRWETCYFTVHQSLAMANCPSSGIVFSLTGKTSKSALCGGKNHTLFSTLQSLTIEIKAFSVSASSLSEELRLNLILFGDKQESAFEIGDRAPSQFMQAIAKATEEYQKKTRSLQLQIFQLASAHLSNIAASGTSSSRELVEWVTPETKAVLRFWSGSILVTPLVEITEYTMLENREGHLHWPIKYQVDGSTLSGFLDLRSRRIVSYSPISVVDKAPALIAINTTHACDLWTFCTSYYPILSWESLYTTSSAKAHLTVRIESYHDADAYRIQTMLPSHISVVDPMTGETSLSEHAGAKAIATGITNYIVEEATSWFPSYIKWSIVISVVGGGFSALFYLLWSLRFLGALLWVRNQAKKIKSPSAPLLPPSQEGDVVRRRETLPWHPVSSPESRYNH